MRSQRIFSGLTLGAPSLAVLLICVCALAPRAAAQLKVVSDKDYQAKSVGTKPDFDHKAEMGE